MKLFIWIAGALLLVAAAAWAVPLTPGVPVPRIVTDNLFIDDNWTPSSKTDNCAKGRFGFDNAYVYWCYSDNNIHRAAFDNTW
jgi:hypothetical protein